MPPSVRLAGFAAAGRRRSVWGMMNFTELASAPSDRPVPFTDQSLIALINAYNRMNVITRQPGGDYQPGQWG